MAGMTHTVREKHKLLARVRRLRGQVEAIERALETEAGCEQVMHLIAGARGAMAGLMAEVVEDHVRTHLVDAEQHPGALEPRRRGAAARRRAHLSEVGRPETRAADVRLSPSAQPRLPRRRTRARANGEAGR